ncbi:MAG: cytochrome c oxidase assembly factor Coa1 family protein [Rhodobacterales bacterium]|nr:cytochrome c oxidase assembly factor Coa1 family protein [Rhodobacterales bacterium]
MPLANQPANTPIPANLDRWNWGAFFLNWIWGLGNSTYIALLMFVPLVNVVMIFVLGAKGSEWAWKNRIWADEDHFVRTQKKWARVGAFVFIGFFALIGGSIYSITALMKNNGATDLAMATLQNDPRVLAAFGDPVKINGFVWGNISTQNRSGSAILSIPISGPKCDGAVDARATKTAGQWALSLLVVQPFCGDRTIVLINKNNIPIPQGPDAGQRDI